MKAGVGEPNSVMVNEGTRVVDSLAKHKGVQLWDGLPGDHVTAMVHLLL